jgi:death on curing protein
MRYLSLQEVISLHSLLIAQSGGRSGLRDRGALESAVAQPEASFGVRICIQISPANLRRWAIR